MMRSLLGGMSFVAFCAASAAHAQTAPQTTPTPQMTDQTHAANRDMGTPAQAASGSEAEGLADIIVTATKVETTLQKTPQAITAIDGNALAKAGVANVQELDKLVGGLQVETSGAAASIYIRGIGSRVLSPQNDPAVAFSVDGVYFARNTGLGAQLFDLSRIEVVKGPQGTLYGRNATGGGVNVITNHPRLGVRSLDGELEVGNYQSVRAISGINLPIGDTMAVRVASEVVYHHGYMSDGSDDDNTKAARVSFLYEPSSDFSLYLSGDYAHLGGRGAGAVPVGPGSNNNALTTRFVVPGHPRVGPSDPRIVAFVNAAAPSDAIPVPFPGVYCVGAPIAGAPDAPGSPAIPFCNTPLGIAPNLGDDFIDDDIYGGNVTAQGDLGFADLTAIGGYRATDVNTQLRLDVGPQRTRQNVDQYTGELRLASKPHSGPLQWLIGGYYLHEKQNSVEVISRNNGAIPNPFPGPGSPLPATTCFAPLDPDGPGPAPASTTLCLVRATVIQNSFIVDDPSVVDESYAGFGQVTYSLTDQLRLTGGIRYTHERKDERNGSITSVYTVPAGVTTAYPSQGSAKFHNVSYRAGAEFDVTPRAMLYANVSTAFHAGGINLGVPQGPNQYRYKPETITAYIAGIKSRFFDNRVQVNLEGFWLNYHNYQQGELGRVNDGSVACSQLLINAACPIGLRIENATSARIRGFEGDFIFAPMENTTLNLNVVYDDGRFGNFQITNTFTGLPTDYSHVRLPNSPPWTVTGGITQAFPLDNGGRVIANVSSQYKSGAYLFFEHLPANYQKGYTRTDLGLTYEAPGAKYSVTAFVRNVENKAAISQGSEPDTSTGAAFLNLNPPRTYGVNLQVHF